MTQLASILPRLALAFALPTLAGFAGCANTETMKSSSEVPASEGTVKATEADNGNTHLAIKVKHLAPPSKVVSDATVYVVWIQPDDAAQQSVGALRLDDNLEGSLDTVTPHRRFAVMVTPEPNAMVPHPTNSAVFTSQVNRPE